MKIVPMVFSGDDERKWQKTFNELFGRQLRLPNGHNTRRDS